MLKLRAFLCEQLNASKCLRSFSSLGVPRVSSVSFACASETVALTLAASFLCAYEWKLFSFVDSYWIELLRGCAPANHGPNLGTANAVLLGQSCRRVALVVESSMVDLRKALHVLLWLAIAERFGIGSRLHLPQRTKPVESMAPRSASRSRGMLEKQETIESGAHVAFER